jgi:hypothetical protein
VSIPFSRSMRSLNTDNYRPSLVGAVVGAVLLMAWVAWFFLARITIYETGQITSVTQAGQIVVDFPAEAHGRIQIGQSALLRFDGAVGDQLGAVPAVVYEVHTQGQDDPVQAELFALSSAVALYDDLAGQAEIEIERPSPADLVLRASGQLIDTPPISLSPQERSD